MDYSEFFGEEAKEYDSSIDFCFVEKTPFKKDPVPEKVMDMIEEYDRSRVLDVGCGTGRILVPIAREKRGEFVGIDKSRRMLEVAARKLKNLPKRPVFLEADSRALPFQEESFDVVCEAWSLNSLEQVEEMERVGRSGGLIIFVGAEYDPSLDLPGLIWDMVQESAPEAKPHSSRNLFSKAGSYLQSRLDGVEKENQDWTLEILSHEEMLRYVESWMVICAKTAKKHGLWNQVEKAVRERFDFPIKVENEIFYLSGRK